MRHLTEYLAFRIAVALALALPVRASVRVCEFLAFVFTRVLPRKWTRYAVARENLQRSLGPLSGRAVERLVEGMWRHLFRMVVEILQLPRKVRLYNCGDAIGFHDRDRMTRVLCSGRPVIFLTGHFGNWEVANRAIGLFGFRMGVVARDLDNPHLHRWFARYRAADGHRLISKNGGGDEIAETLAAGGTVGMLCDQDAGPKGLFVDFLGRPASTFKSIALLAMQFEAVIVVSATRRLPDDFANRRWVKFEVRCEDVIDAADFADDPDAVRAITERYTVALERAVRRDPEQYFWLHRRWKSEPRRKATGTAPWERTRRAA